MSLSYRDKENILKSFPNVELSYERNTHKKVYCSNIYLTIPKGEKFFAWFTNYRHNSVCFFMNINRYKKSIQNITIYNTSFDYNLTSGKGTVFYGTIFYANKTRFFNVEEILYYKGKNLAEKNQAKRLDITYDIFNNYINQKGYTKNDIIFGLPIINRDRKNIDKFIDMLPYDLYCIQHRMLFRKSPFLNEKVFIKRNVEQIFCVKANIQTDIYDLFCMQNGTLKYHNIACINDYKTSVLMNSLFRNIKENIDLDKLEESDDEEEFENVSDDKYVDLTKSIHMKFSYSHKFKLWKPICVENDSTVSNIKDIICVEK